MKTPQPPANYRASVKALVFDDQGRFLLTKEDNGLWELPGGGIDHGEEPHEALKREIREEMGLNVISIKNRPSYYLLSPEKTYKANVIYETVLDGLDFTPSDECVEIRFFSKEEALKLDLYPNVKKFLEMYEG